MHITKKNHETGPWSAKDTKLGHKGQMRELSMCKLKIKHNGINCNHLGSGGGLGGGGGVGVAGWGGVWRGDGDGGVWWVWVWGGGGGEGGGWGVLGDGCGGCGVWRGWGWGVAGVGVGGGASLHVMKWPFQIVRVTVRVRQLYLKSDNVNNITLALIWNEW